MIDTVTIRPAEQDDAAALAALHAEAWRYAYRGIIPGLAIERMVARRGPGWWGAQCAAGNGRHCGTLLLEFDGRIAGYATLGLARIRGRTGVRSDRPMRLGEIYEIYVRPDCHGAGFGRKLFEAARRQLSAAEFRGLVIWVLAENELACGFYAAMGGRARWRAAERLAGVRLEKVAYHWG